MLLMYIESLSLTVTVLSTIWTEEAKNETTIVKIELLHQHYSENMVFWVKFSKDKKAWKADLPPDTDFDALVGCILLEHNLRIRKSLVNVHFLDGTVVLDHSVLVPVGSTATNPFVYDFLDTLAREMNTVAAERALSSWNAEDVQRFAQCIARALDKAANGGVVA